MRTLPRRPETASQEQRLTWKWANPHQNGATTPSWRENTSRDRRDRRSIGSDRRRLTDYRTHTNRRRTSERRWGTTYGSQVGRTSEADAYSPSLGRGPEGGGVDDFRVVPRGKIAGLARRTPFTTGPEILCQAGFLFSKSAFRSTQHSSIRGTVTPEHMHIFEQMCALPRR